MSDALSFAEIDGQHVELLPARTVLSMFSAGGSGGSSGCGCGTSTSASTAPSTGTAGGQGTGMAEFFNNVFFTYGNVNNYVTGSSSGAGGGGTPSGGASGGGYS
jgi:hypothetical protein